MITHGATPNERSCVDLGAGAFTKPSACVGTMLRARVDREMSRFVITEDLQDRIRSELEMLMADAALTADGH
jgi:hypothetical protein